MMLFNCVAIVLVHAVLAVQAGNPFLGSHLPANDTEALCAGKRVDMLTFLDLLGLESIIKESTCSSNVKRAIPALIGLINQTKDDLCGENSIKKLREFYSNYLDTSTNKDKEELPKSLREFALAYGMQMSNSCKISMFTMLVLVSNYRYGSFLNKLIDELVSDKSPVAQILNGLMGPDEILLPADLAPYIKDKQQDESTGSKDNILYVQSATASQFKEIQDACNKKFAPIYRPLIRPIVELVKMGFNYKDDWLRSIISKNSKQLSRWTRLVFLCESLNNMHLVDFPKQANNNNNPDEVQAKTVRILTREEAAEIEGKSFSRPEIIEDIQWPMKFNTNKAIFNKEDRKLKNAIKAFSTSKSEDEKHAKRMKHIGIGMIKSQLKRFKIGLLVSSGYKALVYRIKTGERMKPSGDEIVKLLDIAITHEANIQVHDDGPVVRTSVFDRPQDDAERFAGAIMFAFLGTACTALAGMLIAVIVIALVNAL